MPILVSVSVRYVRGKVIPIFAPGPAKVEVLAIILIWDSFDYERQVFLAIHIYSAILPHVSNDRVPASRRVKGSLMMEISMNI